MNSLTLVTIILTTLQLIRWVTTLLEKVSVSTTKRSITSHTLVNFIVISLLSKVTRSVYTGTIICPQTSTRKSTTVGKYGLNSWSFIRMNFTRSVASIWVLRLVMTAGTSVFRMSQSPLKLNVGRARILETSFCNSVTVVRITLLWKSTKMLNTAG